MKEQLAKIRAEALAAFDAAADSAALDALRVQYLGKKGALTAVLKQMGKLSAEERPAMGQLANEVRAALEVAIENTAKKLAEAALEQQLKDETVDVTIPGTEVKGGHKHPMYIVLDELKDIFNVVLDPAIAQGSAVYTNQPGFNYLDKLKDKDGNYIIQPDPTQKTKKLLFGEYPIVKLSNKVLKNETAAGSPVVPVYCGDLQEAVPLFARNVISLDISTTAGDLWVKDKTGLKVRDRFDVQPVDTEAVVLGKITIPTAG